MSDFVKTQTPDIEIPDIKNFKRQWIDEFNQNKDKVFDELAQYEYTLEDTPKAKENTIKKGQELVYVRLCSVPSHRTPIYTSRETQQIYVSYKDIKTCDSCGCAIVEVLDNRNKYTYDIHLKRKIKKQEKVISMIQIQMMMIDYIDCIF
ncbi:hypothetical protein M9Y10_022075 [Tritrichomonas musculus]|uniref:Uncharacterized protein n=1 Tax=Tritrichomonas musculus TaxID=1915356 RepID=A0ABR2KR77_9EUKA